MSKSVLNAYTGEVSAFAVMQSVGKPFPPNMGGEICEQTQQQALDHAVTAAKLLFALAADKVAEVADELTEAIYLATGVSLRYEQL